MEGGSNLRAVLLALAAFGIFATHDVIVKFLGADYAAFQVMFFSVLFGFPLITVMLLRDETVGTLRPVHPWWTAARTAAAVITGVSAFYAFSVLPLAQTYAIIFASPLLITLLSIPMLGEQVGLRRMLAVLVGLAGVIVVLRPGQTDLGIGHLAALAAAIFGAFASIIVRKVGKDERSVVLILYPMVANFVLMACALPFVYKPMPIEDMGAIFAISALALVATSCLIAAYKAGAAILVAPMQYSQILWAALYGTLFFGESPSIQTGIGAGIIIASGLYIVLREDKINVSGNQPVLRTRSRFETGAAPRVGAILRAQLRSEDAEAGAERLPIGPQSLRGVPGRGGGPRR